LKIAEELAAVKAELATLKSELDRIHRREAASAAARTSLDSAPPSKSVARDIPARTEMPENKTDDAVFDDFGVEEEPDGESVGGEEAAGEESARDETGFFDIDEGGDKITLTSDELDLLSDSADGTPEEMEDPFFTEDSDEEKIAFTGDEINNILDGTEIRSEKALDDVEEDAQDVAEKPAEEPPIEYDDFDINIETVEESLPEDSLFMEDAEMTLDEEPFDIEIDDELPEEEPETADIAFDPFGSLPDDDVLDEDVLDEGAVVTEEPAAGLENGETLVAFPVAEEPSAEEEPGEPSAVESVRATENDSFAGLPSQEEGAFDESFTADTSKTEENVLPDEAFDEPFIEETLDEEMFIEEPAETDELPETRPLLNETFEPDVEADPELSRLMDEDIRQMSPAPDDTSYLDDEKPLEFDEIADPEPPAPFEPPEVAFPETPDAALPEAIVPFPEAMLQEAALQEAALQEAAPDAPTVPSGEENPALKEVPQQFKEELRTVLSYMDILLESLPEEKIEEFARSEHFEPYKKLFKELGLV
jgi:hypothetical protein